jgi:5-methylcytosine-specific restriction endonuclease McrA
MRILAGRTFQNQKLCKEWVKSKLESRVEKVLNQEDKDLLLEIIKGYPDQTYTEGVTDFSIFFQMNNIALDIWKGDTRHPISWVKCVTGRQSTDHNRLKKVLRNTIESQIKEFREKAPHFCEECGTDENLQVDHIIMFKDLVEDFNRNRIPPTDFLDAGRGKLMFKEEDRLYHDEWVNYHKNEATLRILCQKHNLARNKKIEILHIRT